MMGFRLILLLLALCGLGPLFFPPLGSALKELGPAPVARLWAQGVQLPAIPLSLLVLSFFKSPQLARFLALAWGFLLSILSSLVLIARPNVAPSESEELALFAIVVLVLSLALTVTALKAVARSKKQ